MQLNFWLYGVKIVSAKSFKVDQKCIEKQITKIGRIAFENMLLSKEFVYFSFSGGVCNFSLL